MHFETKVVIIERRSVRLYKSNEREQPKCTTKNTGYDFSRYNNKQPYPKANNSLTAII